MSLESSTPTGQYESSLLFFRGTVSSTGDHCHPYVCENNEGGIPRQQD